MLRMRFFRRKRGRLHTGTVSEPRQALFGRPREMPNEAKLDQLRTACARHPDLAAAFLAQRFIPDLDETPTIVLGLRLDDPSQAPGILGDIGDAVHPLCPADRAPDFEILDEGPSDPWVSVYEKG
jgi:hypothetical protein